VIRLEPIRPGHAPGLAQLQRDCFPTLGEQELMNEEHFLSHCRVFPEGGFVLLDGERVIGLGSGFLTDFDFTAPSHSFREIIADGFYTNHDPAGEWYYGADIGVHPDYRGQGLGTRLYEARKDLVRRYRLRGIVAGGVLPGYARWRGQLSVAGYVARVVSGELTDPTLSFQLKKGFSVRGLLPDYLEDSASDNWAALIAWDNPDWPGED
jgi:GNAT superfamily N-acetyltransferase